MLLGFLDEDYRDQYAPTLWETLVAVGMVVSDPSSEVFGQIAAEGNRIASSMNPISIEYQPSRDFRGYNPRMILQVASIVPVTEAEGPGRRFALWFQGCPLRCPGCCNPEYLPFKGGTAMALEEVAEQLLKAAKDIEGVTLLGGEPFAHAPGAAALAEVARSMGLTVMVFTGYLLEDLAALPGGSELLALTDILVDGPYDRERPDTARRWIGSTNQRIHFLTDRYRADDDCWRQRNTLEIRVRGSEIMVNGFPASPALGLWKGWKRPRPLPTATETKE